MWKGRRRTLNSLDMDILPEPLLPYRRLALPISRSRSSQILPSLQ
jgi:hypothetical protein